MLSSGTAGKTARRRWIVGVLALVLVASVLPFTYAADSLPETAIVWIADISSSITEIDPQRYWSDAVSLGVDLAPANTKAAFIAVNDTVTEKTPLLDVSNADNRAEIKRTARNAAITGYTDFGAGLSAALDLLETSSAKDKHIFFVGDYLETGFMLRGNDYSHVNSDMAALTKRLTDSGIKVHMLFMREPAINPEFAPLWKDLAVKTGGEFVPISDPATLTRTVESRYFNEFGYNRSVTTGINTSDIAQDIPIRLPAFGLDRARIYVSSDAPLRGMQARADGVELSFSETRSYFMVDLVPPLPQMVTLSLPPNGSGDVRVYLLADGDMSVTATADSEAALNEAKDAYRQKTTITLTPMSGSGVPLFTGASAPDANWSLAVTDPNGQTTDVGAEYMNGTFIYDFYPASFGTYTFDFSLESQGIRLTAEAAAEVSEIEVPIVKPPTPDPIDYWLWIAIAIGLILIIAALLFARSRRRRHQYTKGGPIPAPLAFPTAVPSSPSGAFTGKLDIYGVLVEGGKAEIPTTSFKLGELGKRKSTNLALVFEQAGVPYHYPEAMHIHLSAGPDYNLTVQNNSGAVIYCGAQPRYRGQQAVLTYGQKMRVVFEEDENEYEIYYHNSVQMAVSGDHIHMELANQSYT